MEKVQLVYAELINGVCISMLEDPLVAIISDGSIFIVTTKENSQKYKEGFYPVGAEAKKSYHLHLDDGVLKYSMD